MEGDIKLSLFVAAVGANSIGTTVPDSQLRYAERDALRFHRAMATQQAHDMTANILLDNNVYRGDAMPALTRLLAEAGNDDHVVLYFAGHGIIEITARGSELFLGVHGTHMDDIEGTALSLQAIADSAEVSKARSCTVMLDCCFGGGLNARSLSGPRYLADLQSGRKVARLTPKVQGEGRLLIGAAKKDRRAYESTVLKAGFFTHHLLQSLYKNRAEHLVPASRVYSELLLALNVATNGRQIPVYSGDDGGAMLPTISTTVRNA